MANVVYENVVIESLAKDLLETAVNTRNLMTIDGSLAEEAGMTKRVNVYTYSGEAEALAAGVGSTSSKRGKIEYEGQDYKVAMIQQAFDYTDEDAMQDGQIVDMMTRGAVQVMANKLNADYFGALANPLVQSSKFAKGTKIGYEAVVDAIGDMNIEDESGLFLIVCPEWKGDIRKDADFKSAQLGEVVYNGQVGTIAGIPVIVSKALTGKKAAYIASREAVTCFMKKDVSVEQDRDKDKRINSTYLRTAYVVALTDATKVRKIEEAAA